MQHSVFSVCLPLHVFLLLVCVCFSVVIGVCVCVCVCVCRVKWCRCICRDTCRRAHTQLHMTSIKVISLQTTCCWLKPTVSHKHTHTHFSFLFSSFSLRLSPFCGFSSACFQTGPHFMFSKNSLNRTFLFLIFSLLCCSHALIYLFYWSVCIGYILIFPIYAKYIC